MYGTVVDRFARVGPEWKEKSGAGVIGIGERGLPDVAQWSFVQDGGSVRGDLSVAIRARQCLSRVACVKQVRNVRIER